jgi:hypothetical protein
MNVATIEIECCCNCRPEKFIEAFKNSGTDDLSVVTFYERQAVLRSDLTPSEIVSVAKAAGFSARVLSYEKE